MVRRSGIVTGLPSLAILLCDLMFSVKSHGLTATNKLFLVKMQIVVVLNII